jgi:hypothetical protein
MTDYRNLIDGKIPEIGNPEHIKEYKRRIDVQNGLSPITETPPTNLTINEGVVHFNCPKCSYRNDIKLPKNEDSLKTTKCSNSDCANKFIILVDTVYVKNKNISKDEYAEWGWFIKMMKQSKEVK